MDSGRNDAERSWIHRFVPERERDGQFGGLHGLVFLPVQRRVENKLDSASTRGALWQGRRRIYLAYERTVESRTFTGYFLLLFNT